MDHATAADVQAELERSEILLGLMLISPVDAFAVMGHSLKGDLDIPRVSSSDAAAATELARVFRSQSPPPAAVSSVNLRKPTASKFRSKGSCAFRISIPQAPIVEGLQAFAVRTLVGETFDLPAKDWWDFELTGKALSARFDDEAAVLFAQFSGRVTIYFQLAGKRWEWVVTRPVEASATAPYGVEDDVVSAGADGSYYDFSVPYPASLKTELKERLDKIFPALPLIWFPTDLPLATGRGFPPMRSKLSLSRINVDNRVGTLDFEFGAKGVTNSLPPVDDRSDRDSTGHDVKMREVNVQLGRGPLTRERIVEALNVVGPANIQLRGANLEGLDLSGLDLSGCHLQEIQASRVNFQDSDLTGAHVTGAKLMGAVLTGEKCNLTRADFSGSDLTGAQIRPAMIAGAIFSHATLNDVDLSGMCLGESFERLELPAEPWKKPKLPRRWEIVCFKAVDLTGTQLQRAKLIKTVFHGADCTGADFAGADLTDAMFASHEYHLGRETREVSGAGTEKCIFTGCRLTGCRFGRRLQGSDFRGSSVNTSLWGCDLTEAQLAGADLREAGFSHTTLTGATYDDRTRWPDGVDPELLGAVKVSAPPEA